MSIWPELPALSAEETFSIIKYNDHPLIIDTVWAACLNANIHHIHPAIYVDSNGETALHLSAKRGNLPLCRLLVYYRADIRGRDVGGRQPLHFAAYAGSSSCCEFLIQRGANVLTTDATGKNAIQWASRRSAGIDEKTSEVLVREMEVQQDRRDAQTCNIM